jgi:hypothetical protein
LLRGGHERRLSGSVRGLPLQHRDLVRRNVSALVDTPHGREGRPSQALILEQAAVLLEDDLGTE